MLDAHPNISCGPETGFLQDLDRWERRHPHRLRGFGVDPDAYHEHVRELFSWMHEHLAAEQGKPRWADKTPSYALRLDFIDALYPDCQVIHIVRNPLDVVDSWRRKHNLARAFKNAPLWASHVTEARRFGASHGEARYHEVRYESLVADPEGELKALFTWLGEPWDPAVLAFRTHPEPASGASGRTSRADHGPGVFTSSVGVGRRNLGSRLVATRVRWSASALMRDLGYR